MRNQNRALSSGSAVQTVTAEKHHLLQGWHSFWKRSTTCFWTQSKTDKQCAKVRVFPQLNNCNLSAGNTIQSGNTISNPQLQKKVFVKELFRGRFSHSLLPTAWLSSECRLCPDNLPLFSCQCPLGLSPSVKIVQNLQKLLKFTQEMVKDETALGFVSWEK